jgi:hypothetical protein
MLETMPGGAVSSVLFKMRDLLFPGPSGAQFINLGGILP